MEEVETQQKKNVAGAGQQKTGDAETLKPGWKCRRVGIVFKGF